VFSLEFKSWWFNGRVSSKACGEQGRIQEEKAEGEDQNSMVVFFLTSPMGTSKKFW